MEQTFMTIHNLSPEANILFASESIVDILGYSPEEVRGKTCFDYFHPDEVPFARSVHSRGVLLDKAAVLQYARILAKDGRWVSCECCFTIVHDVLVACTSIYRRGIKSERRAIEAPQIRRIFSCSPRDPRYHMLEHLSPKFKMPPMEREPRAALILNRFTRNLTVMFATNAVATILGIGPDEIKDRSFYRCIQENCLSEALRCLESAKANDSIAYLRFWYRDPRLPNEEEEEEEDIMDEDEDDEGEEEKEGLDLEEEAGDDSEGKRRLARPGFKGLDSGGGQHHHCPIPSSEMDVDIDMKVEESIENSPSLSAIPHAPSRSRPPPPPRLPLSPPPQTQPSQTRVNGQANNAASIELEAVVSCTSDGLVVILRKARPPIPAAHPPLLPELDFENGLFAAPWGQEVISPSPSSCGGGGVSDDVGFPGASSPELLYNFRPPLMPQYMPPRGGDDVKTAAAAAAAAAAAVTATAATAAAVGGGGGPPIDQLMRSIRDVAVFAWALAGINGNITMSYGRGRPLGEAQPAEGLPVWDPLAAGGGACDGNGSGDGNGAGSTYLGPENQAVLRWAQYSKREAAASVAAAASAPAPAVAPSGGLPSFGSQQRAHYTAGHPENPQPCLRNHAYGQARQTWPPAVMGPPAVHHYQQQQQEPPHRQHHPYVPQPHQQQQHQASYPPPPPQQQQHFTTSHHQHPHLPPIGSLPREQWWDGGPSVPPAYSPSDEVPTTGLGGGIAGYPSQGFRYMWQ